MFTDSSDEISNGRTVFIELSVIGRIGCRTGLRVACQTHVISQLSDDISERNDADDDYDSDADDVSTATDALPASDGVDRDSTTSPSTGNGGVSTGLTVGE